MIGCLLDENDNRLFFKMASIPTIYKWEKCLPGTMDFPRLLLSYRQGSVLQGRFGIDKRKGEKSFLNQLVLIQFCSIYFTIQLLHLNSPLPFPLQCLAEQDLKDLISRAGHKISQTK